jgi:Fe2+ transport system protein FeoA
MSSVHLAFSSDRRAVSTLHEGAKGVVVEVCAHSEGRTDRLLALGVTPGASITVLQTFPGVVLLCDQTELAIERGVADAILVRPQESRS